MPKRVAALNARQIERWRFDPTENAELIDGLVPGLRAVRTAGGTISWSLSVRINGVRRRIGIGKGLGLAEARENAQEARSQIAKGHDPTAERKAAIERQKAAAAGLGTLGAVIDAYYEKGPGAQLRSGKAARALIETVFAAHLQRPSMDVKAPELQLLIDGWRSRSSGHHSAAYFRPLARWAWKRGLMIKGDALEAPDRIADIKQRVLTHDEVRRLLQELSWKSHDAAARFMLLTGARCGEVCNATWDEIDLDKGVWIIPADRRKNTRPSARRAHRDHSVPLSRQALTLLRRLEAVGKFVFVGERGARLTNWSRWSRKLRKDRLRFDVSPHSLRRTCATLAGDLGHAPHVVSALLGHRAIGGQLVSGYNQSRYTREVEDALQQVADLADTLAADNIVSLASAARRA